MKKIITSAGVVALSAISLQAAYAPGLTPAETAKPWSLSASLRGFYDDNYATRPKPFKEGSFGFEVSPSVGLNLPLDQTFIGMSYVYSMRYYENRSNSADHNHQFNAKLDHAFSERYKLELSDSFVIAQEPSLIEQNGIITIPLRAEGNNIHNTAMATFNAQMTQLFGVEFGYSNKFYDYEGRGVGRYSALLDRMEHLGSINFKWQALKQTVAILGYQFGLVDYSSSDPLFVDAFGTATQSSIRNNRSHYLYVGADQNFNSQLNGSIRLGGQYTDYVNQNTDSLSPYVDANLTYSYNPGSYLQAGVTHKRAQTDVLGFVSGSNLTLSQESTAVYVSLTHKITAKLTGSLLGQVQKSTFEGGSANDESDIFGLLGANLAYRINKNFLLETGYNYTKLDSDLGGRSFSRNQVYLGVRATY